MSKPSRIAIAAALCAGAFASVNAAAARTPYDGAWSVLIVTERGNCDRAYRYPVRIADGRVSYGGGGSFTVSGGVRPTGQLRVSIRRGEQAANGVGRLSGSGGSGTWTSRQCGGTWTAERR